MNGTLNVVGNPLLTVNALGSKYVLTFPTVLGQIYQLQSETNLAVPNWLPLGGAINGTGSSANVTNDIGGPQSFFRLQITP